MTLHFCLLYAVNPHWVNYKSLYTLENLGCYFFDDIVRPIHISIDVVPVSRSKQPTLNPFAHVLLMLAYGFSIQKTALGGIALFGDDDSYPDELGLVREHVNEPCMRYLDKGLIVAFPHVHILFPLRILAEICTAFTRSLSLPHSVRCRDAHAEAQ